MTAAQPAPRALSTVFAIVMAAAAAIEADRPALVLVALCVVAVVVALRFRAVATLAVLLAVSTLVISDASAMSAALCGLSATAYLVLRHAVGPPVIVTATEPTVVAAVGFTLLGLVATAVPLELPWVPVAAPLAVFGIYALITRPFVSDRGR